MSNNEGNSNGRAAHKPRSRSASSTRTSAIKRPPSPDSDGEHRERERQRLHARARASISDEHAEDAIRTATHRAHESTADARAPRPRTTASQIIDAKSDPKALFETLVTNPAGRKAERPEVIEARSNSLRQSLVNLGIGRRFVDFDIDARDPQLQLSAPGYYRAADRLKELLLAKKLFAFVGPRGRGKTALACALCRWLYPRLNDKLVFYRTASEYLDGVRAAGLKVREFKKKFEDAALLVLDEIQDRDAPTWLEVSFAEVIDKRYANFRPTLLLSNLTADALIDNVGHKTERRLREEGGIIEATWPRIQEILGGTTEDA